MKLSLALAVAFVPVLTLACPACARDGTPHLGLLIGSMIAAPYAVVALVLRGIRGALR